MQNENESPSSKAESERQDGDGRAWTKRGPVRPVGAAQPAHREATLLPAVLSCELGTTVRLTPARPVGLQ